MYTLCDDKITTLSKPPLRGEVHRFVRWGGVTIFIYNTPMNFNEYFQKLGFTNKEAEIYETVYKLGTKPASTIAKHVNMERTNVYKLLRKMAKSNLVSETMQGWVKQFFIPSSQLLQEYVQQKREEMQLLEKEFGTIEQELKQYEQQQLAHVPKISLYDGITWIKNLYTDMYNTTITNNYLVIKFFASNTFESQVSVHATIKDYYHNIFDKLEQRNVTVDAYLGNGVLIMENIAKTTNIDNLQSLPAGNSAINLFIVGKTVYIVIFKDVPFGIKLDSEDFANAMHFLFEKLQTE